MQNNSKSLEVITPSDLLMTNSPLTPEQLKLFYQKTPADKVMRRPARGGGYWDYIKTGYVVETLNRVFGYMWSFEVLTGLEEAAKIAASGTCVVKGRLTVYVGDRVLIKEQFGRCEVKYKKGEQRAFLDFGNDMKGAASDALKKCASELGLFRDIYHKEDFQELDLVSEEEKEDMEAAEIEEAKASMQAAKDIVELQGVFIRLPKNIRLNPKVIASKDALKRKFNKKKGAKDEKNTDGAK